MIHNSENDEYQRVAGVKLDATPPTEDHETGSYIETRAQTLRKIAYYLLELTDEEVRLVKAFITGMRHGDIKKES